MIRIFKTRIPIQNAGMTIIEVLLVLIIGAALLVLSLQQYQTFKRYSDVRQLQYNVDVLFAAAAQYYQANCSAQMNPISSNPMICNSTSGNLDPHCMSSEPSTSSFPIAVTIDTLQQDGFLAKVTGAANGTPPFAVSPLVDNSGTPSLGYIIQYNFNTSNIPARTVTMSNSGPANYADIVLFKIQISVKLKDPGLATEYAALMAADCISDISSNNTGKYVTPCWSSPTANDYLVWERLPSKATPTTDLWITNPTLKQFNQMYENYPVQYSLQTMQDHGVWMICGG